MNNSFAHTFTPSRSLGCRDGNHWKVDNGCEEQFESRIIIFSEWSNVTSKPNTSYSPDVDEAIFEIDDAPEAKMYPQDDCIQSTCFLMGKKIDQATLVRAEYNFRVGLMVAAELAKERKAGTS